MSHSDLHALADRLKRLVDAIVNARQRADWSRLSRLEPQLMAALKELQRQSPDSNSPLLPTLLASLQDELHRVSALCAAEKKQAMAQLLDLRKQRQAVDRYLENR